MKAASARDSAELSAQWSINAGLLLAGCATGPLPVESRRFVCDQGREFTLFNAAGVDDAVVEVRGMQFHVHAEPATAGERWSCSVLRIAVADDGASLDIDGSTPWRGCRVSGS